MGETAEMRYMDNQLHQVIQRFKELSNYNSNREAQKQLAQRLEQIPFGMLLNQPLQDKKKEKEERDRFLKV